MENSKLIDGRTYSGAIYDIIKFELEFKENFVLPREIVPQFPNRYGNSFVFGRAFTARGDKTTRGESGKIEEMIDALIPESIYILQANDNSRAHFGDIMGHYMSRAKIKAAIIQGWTRDIQKLNNIEFKIWSKGVQPQDSIDRWDISNYLEEIVIGNIFITPSDYIFADRDSVLVIRDFLYDELIEKLPSKLDYEETIRKEIERGTSATNIKNTLGRW